MSPGCRSTSNFDVEGTTRASVRRFGQTPVLGPVLESLSSKFDAAAGFAGFNLQEGVKPWTTNEHPTLKSDVGRRYWRRISMPPSSMRMMRTLFSKDDQRVRKGADQSEIAKVFKMIKGADDVESRRQSGIFPGFRAGTAGSCGECRNSVALSFGVTSNFDAVSQESQVQIR